MASRQRASCRTRAPAALGPRRLQEAQNCFPRSRAGRRGNRTQLCGVTALGTNGHCRAQLRALWGLSTPEHPPHRHPPPGASGPLRPGTVTLCDTLDRGSERKKVPHASAQGSGPGTG